ncbi:hypothetical protein BK816_00420 [Boudabousia tangfeifanii]|uniref:Glycosyltransferase 2-like domain-containing protein n=1 Tax=Boudabousia tangfeifanii TaxID=1912795 RepID=A0A1D9MIB0_9ACTO|nr:CDP-glycerol glycerophosphotransferase family protein [Boudabousia tangfeifanii]AOZ71943.1 hypothetical protein BK816_00420 [Boudabousia tangfeifanii]
MSSNHYLFSVLIATYNVSDYIKAFLKSLEWQSIAPSKVQYIFVDDCSPDDSGEIARKWCEKHDNAVYVKSSQNAGPANARNLGLEVATGKWITAADPDDILDRDYFANVERILHQADNLDDIAMVSTRVLVLNDETGVFKDNHPLGFKFRNGDRLVSLVEDPYAIQLGATAFMRRDRIEELGLRYRTDIKPTFEDAHLLSLYLLSFDEPVMALASSALYYYRKRSNNSSLVQSGWARREKYTTLFENGYLDLTKHALEQKDKLPDWVIALLLYELVWYFQEEMAMRSKTAWVSEDPELKARFLNNVAQIFALIPPKKLLEFKIQNVRWVVRESLFMYYYGERFGGARLYEWGASKTARSYTLMMKDFDCNELAFFVDGRQVHPEMSVCSRYFFGERFAFEVSFDLPLGETAIFYRGRMVSKLQVTVRKPVRVLSEKHFLQGQAALSQGRRDLDVKKKIRREVKSLTTRTSMSQLAWQRARAQMALKLKPSKIDDHEGLIRNRVRALAASEKFQEKYAGCWLVMDRPMSASDNGEHLYRYLLNERPDINAYFILDPTAAAWPRLAAEGFKLLAFGSDEAMAAFLVAKAMLSSDAIEACMYPAPRRIFKHSVPFFFLQHGITGNDISRWLNDKRFSGFICGAKAEYDYLSSVDSPFTFKNDVLVNLGFARFDALPDATGHDLSSKPLLIMPTWRGNLTDELKQITDPSLRRTYFTNTEFYRKWHELLSSPKLRTITHNKAGGIIFVLHPNLAQFKDILSLPEGTVIADLSKDDFQEILLNSCALLTDYSSTAFDAAYTGRAIFYYRFDEDTIFSGENNFRRGWYEPEENGLGPVALNPNQMLDLLDKCANRRWQPDLRYRKRRRRFFGQIDNHNSQRIVEFVEKQLP